MAVYGTWKSPVPLRISLAALLAGAVLAGCNRPDAPSVADETAAPPSTQPDQNSAIVQAAKAETRLHQSFAEATLADMPEQYLPDRTLAGKSVGKLYEEVVRRWDHVSFLTAKGEKLAYQATIETELGSIDIDLLPELAPNHVRNFIVLAQCGYYDGLVFERTISEQSESEPENKVELIEGGCPVGLGNPGYGSIGYWLKPEFQTQVRHEEGTVGACRWEDPETAACRFYITLSKVPVMDGERTIFGKVARGLDVVKRINTQPRLNTPEFPLGDRPEKPVIIRKVTIKQRSAATTVAHEGR